MKTPWKCVSSCLQCVAFHWSRSALFEIGRHDGARAAAVPAGGVEQNTELIISISDGGVGIGVLLGCRRLLLWSFR